MYIAIAGCSYGVNDTCFDLLGGHHQVYKCYLFFLFNVCHPEVFNTYINIQ